MLPYILVIFVPETKFSLHTKTPVDVVFSKPAVHLAPLVTVLCRLRRNGRHIYVPIFTLANPLVFFFLKFS